MAIERLYDEGVVDLNRSILDSFDEIVIALPKEAFHGKVVTVKKQKKGYRDQPYPNGTWPVR